ncbi:conserved phage C-terminal domain-containing protein [Bacillus thuringiensis]|uniref:Phage replication protein n=1 Tax=Bacillus thuringiensis TaxID=1428 RepID=A0A9X6Y756_BACTU|nr:conserved phage C-terminal domain-containing protein [Bacillus thuringiensis]PEA85893.1 phage replication protein [Bacillus thuringiensis]
MGIYRVIKDGNYTTINNTGLRDRQLSWKAKGILAYLLSLPDDWKVYMTEIINHATDGKDSFNNGMKELKNRGYVKRFPIKGEDGKIKEWETLIYEVPQTDYPVMENPQVEKPLVDNPPLLSTNDLLSTDSKLNTDSNKYIVEIVTYLNSVCGTKYKTDSEATAKFIQGRLKDFSVEDLKRVIDVKHDEWTGTSQAKYLRPQTLFNKTNFEGYLQQWELWKNGKTRGYNARSYETSGGYAQEKARRRIEPTDNRGFAKTIG